MIAFHPSLKLRDLLVDNGLHAFIDRSILQDQIGAMDTNQDNLDGCLCVDANGPPWFGREGRRDRDARTFFCGSRWLLLFGQLSARRKYLVGRRVCAARFANLLNRKE